VGILSFVLNRSPERGKHKPQFASQEILVIHSARHSKDPFVLVSRMVNGRKCLRGTSTRLSPIFLLKTLLFVIFLISLCVPAFLHQFLIDNSSTILVSKGVGSTFYHLESISRLHSKSRGNYSYILQQDPERKPILKILHQAGYDFNDTTIFTEEVWESLPKWSDILNLYGKDPITRGLETCEAFRSHVSSSSSSPPNAGQISVAGLFNSGTNILWSSKWM